MINKIKDGFLLGIGFFIAHAVLNSVIGMVLGLLAVLAPYVLSWALGV